MDNWGRVVVGVKVLEMGLEVVKEGWALVHWA
jgi:hypothetical protein